MITVWSRRKSIGATLLVKKLQEFGHDARRMVDGVPPGNAILWGRGGGNKYRELETLAKAGIPVPAHSLTPKPGWLARRFHHMEANDLLAGLTRGDYYVEYVETTREYRVHIFDERCIRVAMKEPRTANPHPKFRSWRAGWKLVSSPQNSASLPRSARTIAAQAVRALGYDFGAVDVGIKPDGKIVVWEVNSSPGIEGGTVESYARAILARGR